MIPFVIIALFLFCSPVFAADIDNDTCFACHGDPAAERAVPQEKFEASAHGKLRCTGCHSDITGEEHDVPLKKVECGNCHRIETEVYKNSDHGIALGAGISSAASCKACHGEPHGILNSRNAQSPVHRSNIPKTCAQCHAKTEEMARFQLSQPAPIVSYAHSVHGRALSQNGGSSAAMCTDCHGSHDLHKPTNPQSKLFWQNIPATCGKCHENISRTYLRSVHGKAVAAGKRDAPVCTDCHGEHAIAPVKETDSKVSPAHITQTCGQCHAAERIITKYQLPAHVVETYMGSFHGLAAQLGSVTAANCASCHGAHDILPSDDTRSTIYPANLARTCGKCHAGVSEQVARGQIHSGTRPGLEHRVVSWVRIFYWVLISLVIGGMVLHNGMDFLKKLKIHYRRMRTAGQAQRMSKSERLQHAFLFVSFTALAYTGFALKFPQAWWAAPFMGQGDWRSLGHRAAAVLFCLLAGYHALFLIFTPRGRHELRLLLPVKADFVQPFQMLGYYLGRRKERPIFGKYGYIEKAEYWALVWGSIIMVLTGALMTVSDWTLTVFPKWFFDVVTAIHYYEAILACSAIVVWHFYFVIFDPDEYPMKWSWVSGRGSSADERHRKKE